MRQKGGMMKPILRNVMLICFLAWTAGAKAETISVGSEKNMCRFCHGNAGKAFAESVHAKFGVTCVTCHGGDGTSENKETAMSPEKGFRGKIEPGEVPALCASCHSDYLKMRQYGIGVDQYSEYKTSIHGMMLLEEGDTNVARCTSCHGTHDILRVTDPGSRVYPKNVPATCGKCHGNKVLMAKYGLTTKEVDGYARSVHGEELLKKGNLAAPSCASCHGNHGAVPPGMKEVVNVCGRCHAEVRDRFVQSPHFDRDMRCVDCHRNHSMKRPTAAMFESRDRHGCLSCHKEKKGDIEEYISKTDEYLKTAEMKMKAADRDIEKAAADGMDVRRQKELYEVAVEGMEKFKVVQHELTLSANEDILGREVNSPAEQIQTDVEVYYAAAFNRKVVAGIVCGLFLLLAAIIYLRFRIRREAKG